MGISFFLSLLLSFSQAADLRRDTFCASPQTDIYASYENIASRLTYSNDPGFWNKMSQQYKEAFRRQCANKSKAIQADWANALTASCESFCPSTVDSYFSSVSGDRAIYKEECVRVCRIHQSRLKEMIKYMSILEQEMKSCPTASPQKSILCNPTNNSLSRVALASKVQWTKIPFFWEDMNKEQKRHLNELCRQSDLSLNLLPRRAAESCRAECSTQLTRFVRENLSANHIAECQSVCSEQQGLTEFGEKILSSYEPVLRQACRPSPAAEETSAPQVQ